jgi:hypothetical protein
VPSADTEIDWTTYMQQVSLFMSGERDYSKLKGDTGPLVYPAGHVYIYSGLYYLTDEGRDIRVAQWVFMLLYLATLAVVMQCYRLAKVRASSASESAIMGRDKSADESDPGTAVPPPDARAVQATA